MSLRSVSTVSSEREGPVLGIWKAVGIVDDGDRILAEFVSPQGDPCSYSAPKDSATALSCAEFLQVGLFALRVEEAEASFDEEIERRFQRMISSEE